MENLMTCCFVDQRFETRGGREKLNAAVLTRAIFFLLFFFTFLLAQHVHYYQ